MNTIQQIYKISKRDAFYAYIGFLQIYAHDIKLTEFTDGQIADILMAIENEEVLYSSNGLRDSIQIRLAQKRRLVQNRR